MAKGFKVIPKETPKKEEWDYDKIKQRVKGKQIVFCLPGRGCSYVFLKNFVQLCFDLVQNGNEYRYLKIIPQWSTLHVVRFSVQMF